MNHESTSVAVSTDTHKTPMQVTRKQFKTLCYIYVITIIIAFAAIAALSVWCYEQHKTIEFLSQQQQMQLGNMESLKTDVFSAIISSKDGPKWDTGVSEYFLQYDSILIIFTYFMCLYDHELQIINLTYYE